MPPAYHHEYAQEEAKGNLGNQSKFRYRSKGSEDTNYRLVHRTLTQYLECYIKLTSPEIHTECQTINDTYGAEQ